MTIARNLVLTVSIGERPWFPRLRPYMEAYARRWRADFEVVSQLQEGPDLDVRVRQEKIAAIFRATARYERVLFLDDTVFVRPDAPLLLGPPAALPKPPIWCTVETHIRGWETMLAAAFEYYGVPLRERTLMNSGVMLLAEEHHPMFDLSASKPPKKIGYFVDQLWVSAMRQKYDVPIHDIGPRFNFVGSFLTGEHPPPIPVEDVHFFHLTRGVGDDDARLRAADALLERFG
jgi:hypothetical protein